LQDRKFVGIIPLSMLPLVLAAVLGPIAYELYYLGYATSKNRLQIQNHNWKNTMRLRSGEGSELGHLFAHAFARV